MALPVEGATAAGGDAGRSALDVALRRHRDRPDALIEVLHAAQAQHGHLAGDVLVTVARALKLPLSRVYGVATFYHLFTLSPPGRHRCTVCLGTACHVKRADAILEAVEQGTGAGPGQTTADGALSVAVARCVGTCSTSPVVLFDGVMAGRQTPEGVLQRLKDWTGA